MDAESERWSKKNTEDTAAEARGDNMRMPIAKVGEITAEVEEVEALAGRVQARRLLD